MLGDDTIATRLSKFAGTKIAVITRSSEKECEDLVGQLKWAVKLSEWDLLLPPGVSLPRIASKGSGIGRFETPDPPLPDIRSAISIADDGVHVFVDFGNPNLRVAAMALISELVARGVSAKSQWNLREQPDNILLVVVSRRPNRASRGVWEAIIEAEKKIYERHLRSATNGSK